MFDNFMMTRNNVKEPIADPIFFGLLRESVIRIDNLCLFKEVGVLTKPKEIANIPACMLLPRRLSLVESHLCGGRNDYRFNVDIGIVLKDSSDIIAIQYIMAYAQYIRNAFNHGDNGSNILIFTSLNTEDSGHYNTEVMDTDINPITELDNGAMLYSSGINLVFSVGKIN